MGRGLPADARGGLAADPPGERRTTAIAEERRLLYVGITRARIHLALSWAEKREVRGSQVRRRRSRFVEGLAPVPPRTLVQLPDAFEAPLPTHDPGADPLFAALRAWRTDRARADALPAYVVAHD